MTVQQKQPNDTRIVELFSLLKDAASIELKLTVPDSDRHSTVTALHLDVLKARLRQVVFFDTPDLKLDRAGMVLRARRIRKEGDTVVKLRPLVPADAPSRVRRLTDFRIEVDAMPGAFVCSGSLKAKVDNADVQAVLLGERSIRTLFSREQRSFYREYAPQGLDLDSLTPFGPINLARLKFSPENLKGRTMVAELWLFPDASRILELSTKCAPDEVFQVLTNTRDFLMRHGIGLNGEQQTKTRKAMMYFSRLHSDAQE